LYLHTSVFALYAAANQFACVSLFKDTESRFEIHCTQRRKCQPHQESRISCMFHQLKSRSLQLGQILCHPDTIAQVEKNGRRKNTFISLVFPEKIQKIRL